MASELEAQQLVHSLEQGKGRWWIWLLVAIFGTAALFIVHIWINPLNNQGGQSPFFRGLTDARGMEQAVIARELSRGNGFQTKVISPAAIEQPSAMDAALVAFAAGAGLPVDAIRQAGADEVLHRAGALLQHHYERLALCRSEIVLLQLVLGHARGAGRRRLLPREAPAVWRRISVRSWEERSCQ